MHQHSFSIRNVLPSWLWHNVVFLQCTQDNFVLNLRRIERLWRDVWISVSSKYYNLLHSLEEDDLLDISCTDDIFCVHYAILPRLKRDLDIFTAYWGKPESDTDLENCSDAKHQCTFRELCSKCFFFWRRRRRKFIRLGTRFTNSLPWCIHRTFKSQTLTGTPLLTLMALTQKLVL